MAMRIVNALIIGGLVCERKHVRRGTETTRRAWARASALVGLVTNWYESAAVQGEKMLENIRRIHMLGIGGIGVSGVARILASRGFEVTGSDVRESSITMALREEGLDVDHRARPGQCGWR
jgi:2-polyprenyl-3-methyl-5-hydroxy-6-metoxy-1,4-benzoquinol methylase